MHEELVVEGTVVCPHFTALVLKTGHTCHGELVSCFAPLADNFVGRSRSESEGIPLCHELRPERLSGELT